MSAFLAPAPPRPGSMQGGARLVPASTMRATKPTHADAGASSEGEVGPSSMIVSGATIGSNGSIPASWQRCSYPPRQRRKSEQFGHVNAPISVRSPCSGLQTCR